MMTSFSYVLAPFIGYLTAGSLKFMINSCKYRRLAFKEMGPGGMPSTHNTVTATVASLIAFKAGLNSPALSVALGVVLIVGLDSIGLRKHLESHAKALALLAQNKEGMPELRQRLCHTPLEAFAGLCVGFVCGFILYYLDF